VFSSDPDSADAMSPRLLNLVQSGLVVLDADHHIVVWNNWMVPRSGRAAARVRGHSLFDVVPELRGSRVEAAVLAAFADGQGGAISQADSRSPFPLREAGSFDGPRIDQAITVTPFKEHGEAFCLIEIRDVSGTVEREKRLLDHAEALRARSYVDGLTGIANRRYFDVALERELRRAQRAKGSLALLLVDIDSFKAYNDYFGHQQGDTCLITVAQALAGQLKRPADVAARYGGEEFCAILPDTTLEQAELHANRIREHIAGLNLAHAPTAHWPMVTLSIGVAAFDAEHPAEAGALIEAADKALYAAKKNGRNRVMVAGEAVAAAG
jgi:diguanylate cyclase (GGDEF)-like protein